MFNDAKSLHSGISLKKDNSLTATGLNFGTVLESVSCSIARETDYSHKPGAILIHSRLIMEISSLGMRMTRLKKFSSCIKLN